MDLSKSETLTLCQRFFSAVGLPPGVDNEAAESIVWLASRGYPSLEDLSQSIPELSQFPRISSIVRQLERYSYSGLLSTKDMYYDTWVVITDWLVTNCGNSSRGECQVFLSDARNPYFALPTLLQRSSQGYEFNAEGACSQAVFSNGNLWMNSIASELPFLGNQDDVKICCAKINAINPKSLPQHFKVSSEMRLAGEQLILMENSRIEVKDETYWKLKEVAAKCFVPASEQSRQRGAGAEVDVSI